MTAMDFHTYDNTLYEKVYQTAYQAAAGNGLIRMLLKKEHFQRNTDAYIY